MRESEPFIRIIILNLPRSGAAMDTIEALMQALDKAKVPYRFSRSETDGSAFNLLVHADESS